MALYNFIKSSWYSIMVSKNTISVQKWCGQDYNNRKGWIEDCGQDIGI